VFDLPRRMGAVLEEDALDSAVEFHADAQPLLTKYGHRGAFRGVVAEAEAAARDVGAVLKRRLAERRGDTERAVLLLQRLGEGDESLQVGRGVAAARQPGRALFWGRAGEGQSPRDGVRSAVQYAALAWGGERCLGRR
jgi:hypothetical protein